MLCFLVRVRDPLHRQHVDWRSTVRGAIARPRRAVPSHLGTEETDRCCSPMEHAHVRFGETLLPHLLCLPLPQFIILRSYPLVLLCVAVESFSVRRPHYSLVSNVVSDV